MGGSGPPPSRLETASKRLSAPPVPPSSGGRGAPMPAKGGVAGPGAAKGPPGVGLRKGPPKQINKLASSSPSVGQIRPSKPLPSPSEQLPDKALPPPPDQPLPPPVPPFDNDQAPPIPDFDDELPAAADDAPSMLDSVFGELMGEPVLATAAPPLRQLPATPKDPVDEGDSMLDAVFEEMTTAAPTAHPEESDSMLDAVFDEISAPNTSAKNQLVPHAVNATSAPDEAQDDDLMDSVLAGIRSSSSQQIPSLSKNPVQAPPAPLHQKPRKKTASTADSDDLLGDVLSQIQAGPDSLNRGDQALRLVDVLDSGSSLSNISTAAAASKSVEGPSARAPISRDKSGGRSSMGPSASPMMGRHLQRPRVKSFTGANAAAASKEASPGRSRTGSFVQRQKQEHQKAVGKYLRDTLRGNESEIESFQLMDFGQNNPPTVLKLLRDEKLVVVAGDRIVAHPLKADGKFEIISESGIKVTYLDEETNFLWACGKDPVIKIFNMMNIGNGEAQHSLGSHNEWVAAVALVGQNLIATASADKMIRIWKRELHSLKSQKLTGHLDYVTCLCTVPDPLSSSTEAPDWLASGSCDKTIRFWNLSSLSEIRCLYGHTGWVLSLCLEGTGSSLWSSGRDNKLINWDVKTGEIIREVQMSANVTKLLWNDRTLYAVDDALVITMLRKGKVYKRLSGHTGKIKCMAFMGGRMFSAGEDRVIRIWDARTGGRQGELKGHRDAVNDLKAHASTGKLYSCSDDGTVRDWLVAPTTAADSGEGSTVVTIQQQREIDLMKFRTLRRDPMYRAATICQAIIRMRFVRDSIEAHRIMMTGAKARYMALNSIVSFEQGFLSSMSQFLSAFLVPIRTYVQREPEALQVFGVTQTQLDGVCDALFAVYQLNSTQLEKLEMHKLEYPFCCETGSILEEDSAAETQLYMLILDFLPLIVSFSALEVGAGGPISQLFQKVESECNLRLDHGAVRTFISSFAKFCNLVRLPVIQLLRHSPTTPVFRDSDSLASVLARMSITDPVARRSADLAINRLRLFQVIRGRVPLQSSALEQLLTEFSSPGELILDEACHIKSRMRKESARLIVTSMFLFILHDSGNPKKDRFVEVVKLSNVEDLLLQVDVREMLVVLRDGPNISLLPKLMALGAGGGIGGGGGGSHLGLSTSSGALHKLRGSGAAGRSTSSSVLSPSLGRDTAEKILLLFESPDKAENCRRAVEAAQRSARFGTTTLPLTEQLAESYRPGSAAPMVPLFPAILIQYLAQLDDLVLSEIFNVTPSETK